MPARRLLPLLTLAVAAACGRGVDSTGAPATTSTLASGPGVHDHTPHHGGVVGMAGGPPPPARGPPPRPPRGPPPPPLRPPPPPPRPPGPGPPPPPPPRPPPPVPAPR